MNGILTNVTQIIKDALEKFFYRGTKKQQIMWRNEATLLWSNDSMHSPFTCSTIINNTASYERARMENGSTIFLLQIKKHLRNVSHFLIQTHPYTKTDLFFSFFNYKHLQNTSSFMWKMCTSKTWSRVILLIKKN